MAGSSLDGLDVAYVSLSKDKEWSFQLLDSETFKYDDHIAKLLSDSHKMTRAEQLELDNVFGNWIAKKVDEFDARDCDLIAVHGHTVLHEPHDQVSWQLGDGAVIANQTDKMVITTFRSEDVRLEGEGAPLVPMGDFNLFSSYEGCLNLGGIANLSIRDKGIAWDVCPCNQVLNHFANLVGLPFDDKGSQARIGEIDESWMSRLRVDDYFERKPPKSLPNHFFSNNLLNGVDPLTGLRSYSTFIAEEIKSAAATYLESGSRILVTGGGAFNTYLVELLNDNKNQLVFELPEEQIINYKEAIVFAFLGVLKLREEVNVLASVTGATRDSSSGVIHIPK